MKYQPYKYRIHYLLNQLNNHDYEIAKQYLPYLCGVKWATFKDWIYFKEGEGREIPTTAILKMSRFFEVPPWEMLENSPTEEGIKASFLAYKKRFFSNHIYSKKFL